MEAKRLRPDPVDYQIIQMSNCLQLLSIVFTLASFVCSEARDAAIVLDIIADGFTMSVAGCMGAQIQHEIAKDDEAGHLVYAVVQGIPIAENVQPAQMQRM